MKFTPLSPKKSLNKAFLRQRPSRSEIDTFKQNLIRLLGKIDEIEREENQKNHVRDFLRDTYYKDSNEVNTKGTIDLVVHLGKSNKENVGVIAEAKRPSNKGEMFSVENPNSKALWETILYYMEERITANNNELKNLLITNVYEWYIIDANYFDKYIYRNSKIKKLFEIYKNDKKDTPFFYNEVSKIIPTIDIEIPCTYFDIRVYKKWLVNEDKTDDKNLIPLLKILSPYHLLKTKFANDSNSLDKAFYTELLHIIGLTETKEGGKKLIQRKEKGQRNSGSLMESAIVQLDNLDKISRLENPSHFGNSSDERLFNVALELSITWINRILFLKLLEAQVIKYHKGDKDFAFLNTEKVKNFDDLNTLFFQVLAKKTDERNEAVKQLFAYVPYLNSSLFEPTDIEHSCLFISQLKDGNIPVLSNSVLKDKSGNRQKAELLAIDYIFEFLNAYDFSSEGSEDIQEDNKQLINASVLGLIFEKINGYKDGSFFTPGFITMYMCRETIRRAVVQKFNDVKGWNCKTMDELYDRIEDRKEANVIINSIKLVDPAVGSGHFLVSALNEIIAIKSELRILTDRDGKRMKEYNVVVENDELIVTDEDGDLFEYNPTNKESQRVQECLFHEKQTIIENCLFGVDLNPNSVKICRLRLWIELLKNAYYRPSPVETWHAASLQRELETLPNIDINIKCGNSLISRFALDADLKQALKSSKFSIVSYRSAVDLYRNAESKEQKWEMEKLIASIKSDFKSNIDNPFKKTISTARAKVDNLATQINTKKQWGEKVDKKAMAEFEKAVAKLKKLEDERDDIEANKIYENAFEWRFEFPEVLNDDGDFVGFDVVIGNPPYVRVQELKHTEIDFYKVNKITAHRRIDISILFFELGFHILNNNGKICYISSNQFQVAEYGRGLRRLISEDYSFEQIINYNDLPVFEEALTYVSIYLINKTKNESFTYFNINDIDNASKGQLPNPIIIKSKNLNEDSWTFDNSEKTNIIKKLSSFNSLSKIAKCNYGIVTGNDDLFIFDKIKIDQYNIEPLFLIPLIRSNVCKRYDYVETDVSVLYPYKEVGDKTVLIPLDELYEIAPNTYNYLISNKNDLQKRKDSRSDFSNSSNWYSLTRFGLLSTFNSKKIIFPGEQKKNKFGISLGLAGYSGARVFSITCKSDEYFNPVLSVLNSKLIEFYFRSKFPLKQGGYYSMSSTLIDNLPIPNFDKYSKDKFSNLCVQIIENKQINSDTTALESEIDQLVYKLYDLSYEEVKVVDPEFELSEVEYGAVNVE